MAGNNVQRNFVDDIRQCSKCSSQIVVTAAMVRRARYTCNACRSRCATESARRHPTRKRLNNKAYFSTPLGKEAVRRHTRSFRKRYPEKYSAHIAVQSAIRNGSLVKKTCEICGAAAVAHHDDYSKPLIVRWLCNAHHIAHHAMLAARSNDTEGEGK